jgi:hypothetical protein
MTAERSLRQRDPRRGYGRAWRRMPLRS